MHEKSLAQWKALEKKKDLRLHTTGYVLNELATLLVRRAGGEFASDRILNIFSSPFFTIVHPGSDDFLEAAKILKKYSDHSLGFTDALSFVYLGRAKIDRIFTYDSHFNLTGYKKIEG